MYLKHTHLWLSESDAAIDITYDTGQELFTLSLTELEVDEEKTTTDNRIVKERTKTEVYLDESDVKEVIRTLQAMLPQREDE